MDIYPGRIIASSNDGKIIYQNGHLYIKGKKKKVWKQLDVQTN